MSKWMLAAMAFSLPTLALAQGPQARGPVGHELRQDRRELRDDRRDTRELEQLLSRFDRARAQRRLREVRLVQSDLRGLVMRELRESHVELAKDHHELRRDTVELRTDPGYRRGDNLRDRRDDRRDLRQEADSLQRTRAIAGELDALYGRMDMRSLERIRGLMVELLAMAHQEQRQNLQEVREDRHEQREGRPGPDSYGRR